MQYLDCYKNNYLHLPKINNWKILWHNSYWDGPLNGVCEVNGTKCYFQSLEFWHDNNTYPPEDSPEYEDFIQPWDRRFLVFRLTDEQFRYLEDRHKKFQTMVGMHTTYDENGKRPSFHYNETITPETVKQYYLDVKNEKRMEINPISDEVILGWYEW